MTDTTPSAQLRIQIDNTKAEAERLIATANHESIKSQVRLALRDVSEAETWLQQKDIDRRPSILQIVDMSLRLASARLAAVDKALRAYGPDAMIVGGDE